MAVDAARAKSLFLAASDLADLAERAAFLDRECDHPELRARVEALLRAHEASPLPDQASAVTGEFPVQAALNGSPAPPPGEQPGCIIAGRYKLRQQIGEGGMGTVWMADQTEPVKRKVAVKLIRVERGQSKMILARFEAERQAIALMDHPHIAKLLDAGTTDTGSPFFVMELVKGVPLNDFCDTHKLTIPERLNLFTQICSAVQHAHQKGIIHRDLKPSNILVESHDGRPVPKVIDFGLAKATTGLQLSEQSMFTAFGSVMGTPAYMAPEQATFNAVDVDTRADVYALGVILYELLTGTTPITRDTLKRAALDEMLRLVREQEAPTPSSRLSAAESMPSIAASRQTEPAKLGRFVKGELDWIVLKALAKERDRRYETASGFARDVERFLAHEPVTAGPPGATYRLRKFVRRNRPQVVAVSLVLLALVAGVVGTTAGLIEAKRQERAALAAQAAEADRAEGERLAKLDAEVRRAEAEGQQRRAEAGERLAGDRLVQVEAEKRTAVEEKARAEQEQRIAQAVKNFLQTKLLAQADATAQADALMRAGGPAAEAKPNPTVRELLDRAAKELAPDKIEANFPNQPLVQAEILKTVGEAYRGVGEAATSIPFVTRSVELFKARLGPDHPTTLASMHHLALGYRGAGQWDRALPLFEETLQLFKAKLGPDHPTTFAGMNNLALGYRGAGQWDKALPLLEETLKLKKARLGPDHPSTLTSMNNLAVGYGDAGKLDRALPQFEETLKLMKARLGPDHPTTLTSMNNLALGYRDAGQWDKALPLFEETLKLTKAKLGPDNPSTLARMNNLAGGYRDAGQMDKALPLLEETLKQFKAKLGPDHPTTLTGMNNLAMGYLEAGKLDRALPLFEEALKLRKARLGPDHPDTLTSMNNLALGYRGQPDKVLPLFEETLRLTKAKLGPDHPNTLAGMHNLAAGYREAGQLDKALPLLEETLRLTKAKLGPDHPNTLISMNSLAVCYWSLKRLDQSVPLFEAVLPLREKTLGRGHPDTLTTVANLGVNYRDAGRLMEATPLLEEAHRAAKKHASLRWVGPQLVGAYTKAGKPAEAARLIDELLADARKTLPKDSPQLAEQLAPFGLALLGLKRFAEAEPLLRECLAIREAKEPDAWATFNTQSMLGGALLGQEKYADTEPLLVKGYEGLKAREKAIPPQGGTRIPEALDRLIDLYTATNKPDEVKKWQAERAKYPATKTPASPSRK
ncbi:MAG: serine/threonine-protein kinase [Gemmataceae bacterium]